MPAQAPKPAPVAKPIVAVSTATNAPEIVTNVITVTRFLAIPWERLLLLNGPEHITSSSATITAHIGLKAGCCSIFDMARPSAGPMEKKICRIFD